MTADELSDRIAICELKARYCRLLDTKQWDAWTELFTEDLLLDTSEAGGPPPITGRAEAIGMVRQKIETARTGIRYIRPKSPSTATLREAFGRCRTAWCSRTAVHLRASDTTRKPMRSGIAAGKLPRPS